MDGERPKVRVLIGKHIAGGSYIVRPRTPHHESLTLEDAAAYVEYGWEVIIDPADMEAFARWEQLQRGRQGRKKKKWNEW